jgi:hypothetical protein
VEAWIIVVARAGVDFGAGSVRIVELIAPSRPSAAVAREIAALVDSGAGRLAPVNTIGRRGSRLGSRVSKIGALRRSNGRGRIDWQITSTAVRSPGPALVPALKRYHRFC